MTEFEVRVLQHLADIKAMLAKLSEPPQVRHARDLNRIDVLLDQAAVWDRHRHRHRRREEGT